MWMTEDRGIINCLTSDCCPYVACVAHISVYFSVATTNNKGMLLIACPLQRHIIIILSNGDEKVWKKHLCSYETKSSAIDPNAKLEKEFGH